MTTQNLWDAAKAVLKEKFIAIQSYLKKQEKHQIYNLNLCLKETEKEEQKQLVEGFNTPLVSMNRSSKYKINKETQVLNDTLDEMDLIDIFRTFHPNVDYTPSSQEHMEHSPLYHILDHKSNLSKFKKIKIISSIFSDHNTMKVDINYKKKKL